ncbi:MAG: hypothetical protein WCS84_10555 [Nocardioides sp.]
MNPSHEPGALSGSSVAHEPETVVPGEGSGTGPAPAGRVKRIAVHGLAAILVAARNVLFRVEVCPACGQRVRDLVEHYTRQHGFTG